MGFLRYPIKSGIVRLGRNTFIQGRYIDGEDGASFSLPISFPSAALFAISTDCGSGALSTATYVSKSRVTVYHDRTISGSLLAVGY